MTDPPPSLDAIDRQLLGLLQRDGRLTNKELAARVGLAPSSCLARVQRLVDRGVIRGHTALVDPEAVGLRIQALVFVQLQSHRAGATESLRDHLLRFDEVLQLYHIGGAQDLVVHIAVRDTDHLRAVVMDRIAVHEQIRHIETNIVFEHHRAPVPATTAHRTSP